MISTQSPPGGAVPIGTLLIEFVQAEAVTIGAAFETARQHAHLRSQLRVAAELARLRATLPENHEAHSVSAISSS